MSVRLRRLIRRRIVQRSNRHSCRGPWTLTFDDCWAQMQRRLGLCSSCIEQPARKPGRLKCPPAPVSSLGTLPRTGIQRNLNNAKREYSNNSYIYFQMSPIEKNWEVECWRKRRTRLTYEFVNIVTFNSNLLISARDGGFFFNLKKGTFYWAGFGFWINHRTAKKSFIWPQGNRPRETVHFLFKYKMFRRFFIANNK